MGSALQIPTPVIVAIVAGLVIILAIWALRPVEHATTVDLASNIAGALRSRV